MKTKCLVVYKNQGSGRILKRITVISDKLTKQGIELDAKQKAIQIWENELELVIPDWVHVTSTTKI